MALFLTGIIIVAISGCGALLFSKLKTGKNIATGGVILGCLLSAIPATQVFLEGTPYSFQTEWGGPFGHFALEIDRLSAFFLLPHFLLSVLCALYGREYLAPYSFKKNLAIPSGFFNLLVAAIALVLTAQNVFLFLIAWEVMALSSLGLVLFEGEKETVRDAGITYLIATHIGTAFLLVFFILLGKQAGSLEFSDFRNLHIPAATTSLLFIFSLIGFGTKAGFVPFHVWLPEAHPAAPSPVSALMSAVMIKTGIYGILRSLTFLGTPPVWWGWVFVTIGLVSGFVGILFALAQNDIKRTLAYSSVENVGIIGIGIGLGLLGVSLGMPSLASLGFLGALFHILNHAIFKGLLFLGAGSVFHSTHTREMDELGGLIKKMPWTGTSFLIASIAASGLPPLNGFISEFLIYWSAFQGILSGNTSLIFTALATVIGLALIGGLAVAVFTRTFGILFLGHWRGEPSTQISEGGRAITLPLGVLTALCFLIVPLSLVILDFLVPVVNSLPWGEAEVPLDLLAALKKIIFVSMGLLAGGISLLWIRGRLLSKRTERGVTWDCGYAAPTPRMQYTASSFTQPISTLFHMLLFRTTRFSAPTGYFPQHSSSSFSSQILDCFYQQLYSPLFGWVDRKFHFLRRFQHGKMQVYILFIAGVLLCLLIWQFWSIP